MYIFMCNPFTDKELDSALKTTTFANDHRISIKPVQGAKNLAAAPVSAKSEIVFAPITRKLFSSRLSKCNNQKIYY